MSLYNLKFSNLLFAIFFFAPLVSFADGQKSLSFFPEKNGIQILKQKFEFYLMNDEQLQIGDILIDSSIFSLSLVDVQSNPRIKFAWPGALFKHGRIVLKDNAGKGLYSMNFNEETVQFETPEVKTPDLRDEIAVATSSEISFDLIDELKNLPFVTFCVYRTEDEADLTACSREHFIPRNSNPPNFRARSQVKKEAYAEINGRPVTKQGQIFLSGGQSRVSFRAQLKSGTFVEIKTGSHPLDIYDVTRFNDRRIHIKGRGAEPLNQSLIVSRIDANNWIAELDGENPVLYIRGAGDIPLRQDFLLPKDIPDEKSRVFINENFDSVYDESLQLNGNIPEKVILSANDSESAYKIEGKNSKNFNWSILNLEKRVNNRRYLKVTSGGKSFVTGYEVFRGASTDLALNQFFRTSSSNDSDPKDKTTAINLKLTQWWTDFMGVNDDWSHLHWGMEVDYTNRNAATIGTLLHYRFQPGIYSQDDTYGLSLALEKAELGKESFIAIGPGFFINSVSPYQFLGDWMWFQLNYLPSLSGGGISGGSILEISFSARYYFDPTLYWNWNFNTATTKIKVSGVSATEDYSLLGLGLGYQF